MALTALPHSVKHSGGSCCRRRRRAGSWKGSPSCIAPSRARIPVSPSAERACANAVLRHLTASASVSGNEGRIRGDGVRASSERVSSGEFGKLRTVVSAAKTPRAGAVNSAKSGCLHGEATENLNNASRGSGRELTYVRRRRNVLGVLALVDRVWIDFAQVGRRVPHDGVAVDVGAVVARDAITRDVCKQRPLVQLWAA